MKQFFRTSFPFLAVFSPSLSIKQGLKIQPHIRKSRNASASLREWNREYIPQAKDASRLPTKYTSTCGCTEGASFVSHVPFYDQSVLALCTVSALIQRWALPQVMLPFFAFFYFVSFRITFYAPTLGLGPYSVDGSSSEHHATDVGAFFASFFLVVGGLGRVGKVQSWTLRIYLKSKTSSDKRSGNGAQFQS